MLHQMKLNALPFSRMESGEKTLEIRLYDEKRQRIRVGDEILFTYIGQPERNLSARVLGLLIYPSFNDILADVPVSWLGYQEIDKHSLRETDYEVYTQEDEAKYGVLGIRLCLISQ